jgi:hypothetical protein
MLEIGLLLCLDLLSGFSTVAAAKLAPSLTCPGRSLEATFAVAAVPHFVEMM